MRAATTPVPSPPSLQIPRVVKMSHPSGWLDMRTSTTYEEMAPTTPPPTLTLSPSWKMLLFGDASPTRILTLLSGQPMCVSVLGMDSLPAGAPLDVPWLEEGSPVRIPAPHVRRRVWLECGGVRMGYACSWWNESVAREFLPTPSVGAPIGDTVVGAKHEIHRELLSVGHAKGHPGLEEGMGLATFSSGGGAQAEKGVGGDWGSNELWGRWYAMWKGKQVLCLIHEVFSPRLEELLGQRHTSGVVCSPRPS